MAEDLQGKQDQTSTDGEKAGDPVRNYNYSVRATGHAEADR